MVYIDGEAVLASASASGHLAVWDLNNNGRLLHIVRGAHDRAVTSIEWIPNQPVLVSSGEDNSVKVSIALGISAIDILMLMARYSNGSWSRQIRRRGS